MEYIPDAEDTVDYGRELVAFAIMLGVILVIVLAAAIVTA